jgi:hypothetical protein
MNYLQKYKKYKEKYLNLKKLIGGNPYIFEEIKKGQIYENKDKWLIIHSTLDEKSILICRFIRITDEGDFFDFDDISSSSYFFADISGTEIEYTVTRGFRNAGGSLTFNNFYIIKNLNSDIELDKTIEDKIKSEFESFLKEKSSRLDFDFDSHHREPYIYIPEIKPKRNEDGLVFDPDYREPYIYKPEIKPERNEDDLFFDPDYREPYIYKPEIKPERKEGDLVFDSDYRPTFTYKPEIKPERNKDDLVFDSDVYKGV